MTSKTKDEITLREAAELTGRRGAPPIEFRDPDPNDEESLREKREREVGNAGATLDTMLGASRRGYRVRKP